MSPLTVLSVAEIFYEYFIAEKTAAAATMIPRMNLMHFGTKKVQGLEAE